MPPSGTLRGKVHGLSMAWWKARGQLPISSNYHTQHRDGEGLGFFVLLFSRRLISELTERISSKLGHIFTYDCYLK